MKPLDFYSKIHEYESGDLDFEAQIEFLQEAVNAGLIPHLQGYYQRMVADYARQGYLSLPGDEQ